MPSINQNLTKEIKLRSYNLSLKITKYLINTNINHKANSILDQTIRSATSICANIVESKYASSQKDYIKFRYYSLKSANETLYWLQLLKDLLILDKEISHELIKETDEIRRMLSAGIQNLKKKS